MPLRPPCPGPVDGLRRKTMRLVAFCTLAGIGTALIAAPLKPGNTEAELLAETTSIVPGRSLTLALRLKMDPHWHTYWKNPGDAGQPTAIKWDLPAGFRAGEIQWPYPRRIQVGRSTSYGYEDEVLLMTDISVPAGLAAGQTVTLKALAKWLECKDVCIPRQGNLALTLPIAANAAAKKSESEAGFQATRAALPLALTGWNLSARRGEGVIAIQLTPKQALTPPLGGLYFFSEEEGVIEPSGLQMLRKTRDGFELSARMASPPTGDLTQLVGVLLADRGWPGTNRRAVRVSLPIK
jgi:DsbC/DsbD-like thiol-disulfide interchange protein